MRHALAGDVVRESRAQHPQRLRWVFWRPGCETHHVFEAGPGGWTFNGNHARPTVSPSILTDKDRPDRRCHLFITDGQIRYLSDCYHALAATTVHMEPPLWEGEA